MTSPYQSFALSLAKQSGDIIKQNFTLGMTKEWKEDHSPLTATDTAINHLVLERIHAQFPDHSILSEEGSLLQNSDYTWVCDPVDGTIPFSHGVPTSTFSLALTHNGESIVGVTYDPFMDRLCYAEKGNGAYMNGERMHVSRAHDIGRTCINIDGMKPDRYDLSKLQLANVTAGTHFFSLKSTVYAGILVAAGEFAATMFLAKKPWDAAAVKIIVEEAGGKVTDIEGHEQRYDQPLNGILASNGLVHNHLVTLISESKR